MTCPVCASGDLLPVSDPVEAPVFCNQRFATREEALEAPRGTIELSYCRSCGHVYNDAFEPSLVDYCPRYENALHCSDQFSSYASALVSSLTKRYPLKEGTVVEVGCGDGQFLKELCRTGKARGIGFDPSFQGESGTVDGPVQIHRVPFGEQAFDVEPSLLTCRHVLEHIGSPTPFLRALRKAAPERTPTFFEVPNALFTMRDGGIWDILYEHCSYFTPSSLKNCFELAGYSVSDVQVAFEGQFLTLHGESLAEEPSCARPELDDGSLESLVESFRRRYAEKVSQLSERLAWLNERGKRLAVWGAGSKGVMLLNTLGTGDEIAVDLNPKKHGMFVAGTGQPIVAPEVLVEEDPDVVLIMNPVYAEEIRLLLAKLGLEVETWMA